MGKKVFVSYHSDSEGTLHKNLLVAWSKNDNGHFDIKFNDTSVGVSIKSDSADYIKRVIKNRINDSDVFLILIGENTHKRVWCNWEIEKAIELKKKIVAVKINSNYTSPLKLFDIGAIWAKSFKYESMKKALDN